MKGTLYVEDINEIKPEQYNCAIIVQRPTEEGGGMYCPMCLSKVNSLSNTQEGEACCSCRKKHELWVIEYPERSFREIKKKKFSLDVKSNSKKNSRSQPILLDFIELKGGD